MKDTKSEQFGTWPQAREDAAPRRTTVWCVRRWTRTNKAEVVARDFTSLAAAQAEVDRRMAARK
jgi:hypothetical protein